jgi:DNA ligase-1
MITDILDTIKSASGTNEKKNILLTHGHNVLLKKALTYALDPFLTFNIVKVPRVKADERSLVAGEIARWNMFFDVADKCATREVSGNNAIKKMHNVLCSVTPEEEQWMRKILKKHLAVGASVKTINAVFPDLIATFNVSLAQKFEEKRILGRDEIAVEPKLDGIRCFSIVSGSSVKMFARSGKLITNFESTLAPELLKMGDGCYDGELMGEDFISLMRQAYRKDDVDTSKTYLALFDYLPLEEWRSRKSVMTCADRYEVLLDRLALNCIDLELLQPVERCTVPANYNEIKIAHDDFVKLGYEGVMIKYPEASYKFGRGWEVMKFKAFHDVDLKIAEVLEGTGKHTGKMGSVRVNYLGVDVQVGSGFSDELRSKLWFDRSNFIGRMIEVRYQEVTPDGSLRFPTFVCFRNDRC